MRVNFTLDLIPEALPRARHTVRAGYSTSYYTKKTKATFKEYERAFIQAFSDLNKEQRLYIIDVVKGLKNVKIRLNAIFYMPIPKSTSKKRTKLMIDTPHTKRPDTSNLVKLIEDRAESVFYKDDSCIYHVNATKLYSDKPRIEIELEYEGL